MKISLIVLTTIFFNYLLAEVHLQQPEVFTSAPKSVFIPQGFDTNDNVEIFFEGEFSDACQKVGMTSHSVDTESRSIFITDMGYYFGSDFCALMTVPYDKRVNAGMLPEGQWKVYFRHSRGNFVEQATVPVRAPETPQLDNHLYAPVEKTLFLRANESKPHRVILSGKFYNTCMKMDYVKVDQKEGSNVVEILPIAMMERGGCEDRPEGIDFKYVVKMNNLETGRFLLHTRANNGRSVNEIVTIQWTAPLEGETMGKILEMSVIVAAFVGLVSCAGSKTQSTNNASWAGNMQSTAKAFQDLLPYLYNSDKFSDKKNSEVIEEKITVYSNSIHKIDPKAAQALLGDDPYVQKSLNTLTELTGRALDSFKRGDRQNSKILLKATTNTCFKCHTRQNVGPQSVYWKNFSVADLDTSPIEKAHILVSMRLYDDAKKQISEFLYDSEQSGNFDLDYENALHYYLMISLRGQETFASTMNFLNAKVLVANTPIPLHYTLKHWQEDLKYWIDNPKKLKPSIASTKSILAKNKNRYSERNLVNNLVASSLLHRYLMDDTKKVRKAQAYQLLGQAYDELIIEGFWDLPEVYYEMCIDYAPKSKTAKTCYRQLRDNITIGYSGSRGTLIPSKEYQRLEALRKKAGL